MANKLGYRDGGKTSEEGINRITSRLLSNAGVLDDNHLLVEEAGSPDNTVVVAVGDIAIGDNSPSNTPPAYFYHGWVDSAHAETVSANASGNARIDVIVAFVDLTVVDDTDSDNPGALDFMIVAGTPAATPAAPDDSAIQTAVGASNPWVALARIDVANGFSSITDSDITDLRPKALTPEYLADKGFTDFVAEGLLWSQDSGLIGQMTSGLAFINGRAITKGYLTKTFTASKDTYIDLPVTAKPTSTDELIYTEVANGASAPALSADRIRIAKVVTNGSAITSVTTSGRDSNRVAIRKTHGTSHTFLDGGSLDDDSGNELLKFSKTSSAVNELTVKNAATGNAPQLQATGDDTNIDANIVPKGTGKVTKNGKPIDWWEELGRVTLGSAGSVLSLTGLTAKRYIQIRILAIASGGAVSLVQVKLNNDSGSNYSRRTSVDGAADATATSSTVALNSSGMASGSIFQGIIDIVNEATKPKMITASSSSDQTTGAGTAPTGNATFGKWVNSVDQVTRVDATASTNNFAIGSEMIVLGHD